MTQPYQGHPSWQAWNVTLWIGSDEPIYRLAMNSLARNKKIKDAAIAFIDDLGMSKTPDGAEYDLKSVEHALRYLKD
jgi:uncharacterized protein (DUF1810 family)